MEETKELEVFRSAPVPQAVLKTALPAVAAILMVLIYNLADTFFIGLTRDAYQVAAVSMAMPVYLVFMSVGTVFGIGGTSVIARALGEGRRDYAKKVCAFCMWCCVGIGVLLSALFIVFMDQIVHLMGASSETYDYVKNYLTIVSYGGVTLLIGNCFSHVIRAEGQSTRAMSGQLIGNLLNVILDPIMILWLGWGIVGAAVATLIGHIVSAGIYVLYFLGKRSILSVAPRDFTVKNKVCSSVLAIGVPAALASMMMSVSQVIMNGRMVAHGDMAVAGYGVAGKVLLLTGMLCLGFGQGVQPLLGYCIGARLRERYRGIMRYSVIFAFVLGTVMTAVCFIFRRPLVSVFLTDPEALSLGVRFLQILLVTGCIFGVYNVFLNALQAAGAAVAALIVNLSRQGIIYLPTLFLLDSLLGADGLAMAQPIADGLAFVLVLILYAIAMKKRNGPREAAGEAKP